MTNETGFAGQMLSSAEPYSYGVEELGEAARGSLYFVSSGAYCKIGRAIDFPQRLSSLQTGTPERLKVEAVLPGMGWQERIWHTAFLHLRHRGEWFEWTDELQEAVTAALCGEEWIATLRAENMGDMSDSPWAWQVQFLADKSPKSVAEFLWRNTVADAEEKLLEDLIAKEAAQTRQQVAA
jgi:hypothetical protein